MDIIFYSFSLFFLIILVKSFSLKLIFNKFLSKKIEFKKIFKNILLANTFLLLIIGFFFYIKNDFNFLFFQSILSLLFDFIVIYRLIQRKTKYDLSIAIISAIVFNIIAFFPYTYIFFTLSLFASIKTDLILLFPILFYSLPFIIVSFIVIKKDKAKDKKNKKKKKK